MRTLALLPLALAALLAGCGHDDAVPTNADNRQLDEQTDVFYAGIRVITQLIEHNNEHS